MKNKTAIIIFVIVAVILILKRKSIMTYYDLLSSLIPKFESFSSKPYWDVSRYSWGYGTAVPSKYLLNGKPIAGVSISRAKAFIDMTYHFMDDKSYLSPKIKVELSAGQWAALLSFSYNLGSGNADNLIPNINAKNWSALGIQWNKYIYAGGKPNKTLIERRKAEWELFSKSI